MARPISDINLETTTLTAVETSMRCTPTREGFLRLQGISFFYKGCSKQEVSRLLGVTVRAVQKWVKDFNEAGIDGVIGSRRTGRKRKIEPEVFSLKYKEEFLSSAKTAISFYGKLINEHREEISYSTLLNYLHEQGLSRTVGRPTCVQRDPVKREQFITKLNVFIKEEADIWFGDEVGFDGDPKPRKKWVQKGEKHANPFYKLHLRSSAIGAVNPETGELFTHVVPLVDTAVFQHFINELGSITKERYGAGKKIVLVLDNASWHTTKALNWQHIQPLFLPAYSPDFNPIEQLWRITKDRYFNGWYAKNIDELDERVCQALIALISDQEQVKKTASIDYMKL